MRMCPSNWPTRPDTRPSSSARSSADRHDTDGVVEAAKGLMEEHGWDLAICLTDLPLHRVGSPLVADVSARDGVALLSLPPLAGLLVHRRPRVAIVRLAAELSANFTVPAGNEGA